PWRRGRAARTYLVISRIDAARLERGRHLSDRRDERCVTRRDPALVRDVPHAVERVRHLVRQTAADLVAIPEEPTEILHPLEIGDRDTAGVGEDVRQDRDAALREDAVSVARRRPGR